MLGVMHGTGATVQPCEECPIPDRKGMGSTTNTVYYLKDHLGNVRATLLREQPVHAGLLNWASYYPFGLRLTDNATMSSGHAALISSYPQRHWYQGDYSELDPETGLQAFDLRMYSSRIGRWLSVDPYAQYWSPYLAMGNNPVSRVDPDGGFAGAPGGDPSLWQRLMTFLFGVENPPLEGISQKVPKSGPAPKVHAPKAREAPSMVASEGTKRTLSIASFFEASAAFSQIGMISYRSTFSINRKLGNFNRFASTYRNLGLSRKFFGKIGYIGNAYELYDNYNQLKSGKIGHGRFLFRGAGIFSSAAAAYYVTAASSGPFGVAAALLVGGSFIAVEMIYDAIGKIIQQTLIFTADFDRGIKNGWYPGR